MIKVIYFFKDGSGGWTYEVKKLRTAVECIREDMEETTTSAQAVVFDEENNKILVVKR